MGKVTESIFSNKQVVIPMAEVSHVVKLSDQIEVVFKHSKWNDTFQHFEPSVHLSYQSADKKFLRAWCDYRAELEADTLMPMDEFIGKSG